MRSLTLSASLLLAVSATSSLGAQAAKRTQLPDPGQLKQAPVSTKASPDRPNPGPLAVTYGQRNLKLGDEPDYRPMRDVHDKKGNVIAVEPVGNPYTLSFMNGDYTPARGIDPDLRRTLATRPGGSTYGFVMLKGRMSEEKMQRLRDLGLKLLGVHTWQSVKAEIPAAALAGLSSLDFVHWVGYARLGQKIDHNFAPVLQAAEEGELLRVIVNPFESDIGPNTQQVVDGEVKNHAFTRVNAASGTLIRVIPNGRFHKGLTGLGLNFTHYNEIVHAFHGTATKAQVLAMLKQDWIHSIEMEIEPELAHDQAIPMVGQDYVRGTYGGKNVPAGYIDDGLDSTPFHRDFGGKSLVQFANAFTPSSFHGTHVAGTLWGGGLQDGRYRGAAPLAGTGGPTNRLYVSKYTVAFSTNASAFGRDYKDAGNKVSPYPRVISNSWGSLGSGGFSGTEASARTADAATYSARQLWVFAAGNKKTTANWWATSPASAKNVLSVGSMQENWNATGTVKPGNKSSFSRWSVTDRRFKPEVCAPGEVTTSTLWNSTTGYFNTSGTSMATPLVSGCLISLLESKPNYKDKPELLKAIAIASSKNQNNIQTGTWRQPQSGADSRPSTGWGLINSRQMVYTTESTQMFVSSGTFTRSGQSAFSSFTMPSDAVMARVVLCYTEPAASATASAARINAVRGWLDWAPVSTSVTVGDQGAYSGVDNTMVHLGTNVPSTARGKTARIKAYATTILPGSAARWAMAVIVYRKNPVNVTAITTTSGPFYGRPNTVFDFKVNRYSTTGGFRSERLWLASAAGFKNLGLYRITADGVSQFYAPTNKHASANFPFVGTGPASGMNIGSGKVRELRFRLQSPGTNGRHYLGFGSTKTTSDGGWNYCVDGLNPAAISGLTSTTHPPNAWRRPKTINFKWNTPTDVGCAGVSGLAWNLGTSPSSSPFTIDKTGSPTTTSFTVTADSGNYYFHVRSQDKAGNYGPVSRVGPYKIDSTKPVLSRVLVNNGATYTTSLKVSVWTPATDNISGVGSVIFNAGKWGSWTTYTGVARTVDLAQIGATDTPGVKTVYATVSDRANNTSGQRWDSIIYVKKPKITSVSGALWNATKSAFVIRGSGFTGVTSMRFGSTTLTRKWTALHEDDWWHGRIRVASDSLAYLYPPQGRAAGTYAISVANLAGVSNSYNVSLTNAPVGQLVTSSVLTAGKVQYGMLSQGNLPNSTKAVLMIGFANKPSVIPGFVNMGIGSNWTQYLLGSPVSFNSSIKGVPVGGPTSTTMKGIRLYFQAAYLQNPPPLKVSNVASTLYR